MQICVCGWYFYVEFYQTLKLISPDFKIVVIGNRTGDTLGIPLITRPNTGLEWGAFSAFLEDHWDGESDVLFLHDDLEANAEFFDEIAATAFDQAFIFRNQKEFKDNYSHGRAFYASRRFLKALKADGGIWFDQHNRGYTGKDSDEKAPSGTQHYNAGIRRFTDQVKRIGKHHPEFTVDEQIYSKNIYLGRRGEIIK